VAVDRWRMDQGRSAMTGRCADDAASVMTHYYAVGRASRDQS
jgi:hypothetical protein